jgi:hypothetical protein
MKTAAVLLSCLIVLLLSNCNAHFRSSQDNDKSLPLNVKSDSTSAAVVAAVKPDTGNVSTQDTITRPAAEPQVLVVSPRILYGIWQGKDTNGREVSCTFTEAKAGESLIFNVVISVGKTTITGSCANWENNSCELTINAKEIQNIYARWLFGYDGIWLTIQTGDQRIAGVKTFRLKKLESH